MKSTTGAACAILLAALGAGCAKDTAAPAAGSRDAQTTASPAAAPAAGPAAPKVAVPSAAVMYFDFDSSELDGGDIEVVGRWAKYLTSNTNVRITLTGHCDERGTSEYNVALGERRAIAVRDRLVASGVGASQLAVVSYGEDRPAAAGHDEAAWKKNRRVEVVLKP